MERTWARRTIGPGLAEHADGDALVVDIETDVEHGRLLKSLYLGNAATGLQVTRLTEASFIASTPTRARRLADASVDPTNGTSLSENL
jgi:hypothetical protein